MWLRRLGRICSAKVRTDKTMARLPGSRCRWRIGSKSISTTALRCDAMRLKNADSVSIFLFTIRAIVIALTNENAQLERVGHQTARQTAESIAGTELGRSVATVSSGGFKGGRAESDRLAADIKFTSAIHIRSDFPWISMNTSISMDISIHIHRRLVRRQLGIANKFSRNTAVSILLRHFFCETVKINKSKK